MTINQKRKEKQREWKRKNPEKIKSYLEKARSKRLKGRFPYWWKIKTKCLECGEVFLPEIYNQKLCGKECRNKFYSNKKKYRAYINERSRNWSKRKRVQVLEHYGGKPPKCAICGFSDLDCLDLDHKDNDGSIERKKFKTSEKFFLWLIKNNFPEGYQVLCKNCNWKKYIQTKKPE